MPSAHTHRCRVRLIGHHCEHDLCYLLDRAVPQDLRCPPDGPAGYSKGAGGCCVLPTDLKDRIERELRFNLQECRRLGYVPIAA